MELKYSGNEETKESECDISVISGTGEPLIGAYPGGRRRLREEKCGVIASAGTVTVPNVG